MILQLNPTIDVKTPLGDCEAMFLIDYGVNVNSVWVCRMPGGKVKHFYSDDVLIYGNPANGNGWDIEEAPEFEGHIERFPKDPPGKWTFPPDHPDNGGALIRQDKAKWNEIFDEWLIYLMDINPSHYLSEYIDEHYEPPTRFNLKTWVKVQNWYRSLADYKDTPFLDFLVKFYPAPDPKK